MRRRGRFRYPYQLIFDPPTDPDAAIDGSRLAIQAVVLVVVVGGLVMLLKDRQQP